MLNMPVLDTIVEPSANLTLSGEWRGKVYHPAVKIEDSIDWGIITKAVKKRDRHSCKSCGLKIGLTVHHIIPREEGGGYHLENLITLCNHCHDEVEILGLKNECDIINLKKRKYIKQDKRITETDKPVRWQQWVYGGYARPGYGERQ